MALSFVFGRVVKTTICERNFGIIARDTLTILELHLTSHAVYPYKSLFILLNFGYANGRENYFQIWLFAVGPNAGPSAAGYSQPFGLPTDTFKQVFTSKHHELSRFVQSPSWSIDRQTAIAFANASWWSRLTTNTVWPHPMACRPASAN